MHRSSLAILILAAVVLTAPGCRQTTATIPAGPAPPTALSPVTPGQAPMLGPFGGNTKVTPPATGSYQPTGGFPGASPAPVGQPYLGTPQAGNPIGGVANGAPAGVQVAGWNQTNTVAPANPSVNSTFGTNPSSDPRSGGMRVIDLTGAPTPPGYRPSAIPMGPVHVAPQNQANLAPLPPGTPVAAQPQSGWQAPAAAPTTSGQTASTAPPIRAATTAQVPTTSQIPSTMQGPSTEPINQGSGSNNLNWRRPGTQF